MVDAEKESTQAMPVPSELEFHYQKAPTYRALHVDGFYGGVTPRGYIHVSFFNERPAIPKSAKRQTLSSSGGKLTLGPEQSIDTLGGLVRTIDTTVFLDLNAAQEFYLWFGQHVRTLEEAVGTPENERVTGGRAQE